MHNFQLKLRAALSSLDHKHFMLIIISFQRAIRMIFSLDDTPLGLDASMSSNKKQHKSIRYWGGNRGRGGDDFWHKYLYVKSSCRYTPFVPAYIVVARTGTYLMLGSSHSKAKRLLPSKKSICWSGNFNAITLFVLRNLEVPYYRTVQTRIRRSGYEPDHSKWKSENTARNPRLEVNNTN